MAEKCKSVCWLPRDCYEVCEPEKKDPAVAKKKEVKKAEPPKAKSAEEAQHQVMTALSSTTLSGYVDTSANWRIGKTDGFIPGRSGDTPSRTVLLPRFFGSTPMLSRAWRPPPAAQAGGRMSSGISVGSVDAHEREGAGVRARGWASGFQSGSDPRA